MISTEKETRLRLIFLICGLLWSSLLVAGDCIDVQSSEIRELDTEFGITTAEWLADIRNHCDEPYDATLTIKMVDEDGKVVHETLEIVIVESRGIKKTDLLMSIPEDRFVLIKEIEIDIDERVRPL